MELIFQEYEVEEAVKTSLITAYNEVEDKSNVKAILDRGFQIIQTYRFSRQIAKPYKKTERIFASPERTAEIIELLKNPDLSKSEQLSLKRELLEGIEITKTIDREEVTWAGMCPQNGANNVYIRLADLSYLPLVNPFNHKADKNKFIEACQHLFPNVDAFHVGRTLTTFRRVIQNIYYNLGTEGLRPQQVSFYQYSALGGTGKSEFTHCLERFLLSKKLPAKAVTPTGRWIGNDYSSNIVGVVNEFFPNRREEDSIITLNNIIDNTEYEVEYKGRDKFFSHSKITLFINSNKLPFDTNTRRYGIVYYNEIPWNFIPNETKEKYFNNIDWNKWFLQAFESCPFDTTWEDIECKNSNNLNDLIFAAREVIKQAQNLPYDFQNCTIREFAKVYLELMNDFGKVSPDTVKKQVYGWRNDLRKAVAQGLIVPSTRVNGNTDYSKYNFQEIAELVTPEDEIKNSLNDINDVWERTQTAFENFKEDIDNDDDPMGKLDKSDERVGQTEYNSSETIPTTLSGNGTKTQKMATENVVEGNSKTMEQEKPGNTKNSELDSTSSRVEKKCVLSNGWIFNDYFITENGEKGFNKPEYENKMQKQVVINKPLEIKDEPTRKNTDVEQSNFLFEIDPPKYEDSVESLCMTKEEYYKRQKKEMFFKYVVPFIKEFQNNILWVCDSGSKSTHIVFKTNNTNSEAREYIFNYFNKKYFDGKCDKSCKNAARLARNPNAVRENGRVQTSLFIQEDALAYDVTTLVENFKQEQFAKRMQLEMELRHLKKWVEKNNASIEQQFEWIVNKTKSESLKLAYDIYTTKSVASGENMIGAIKAVQTLGPKFSEIAIEVQNICHSLHPSNITKAA